MNTICRRSNPIFAISYHIVRKICSCNYTKGTTLASASSLAIKDKVTKTEKAALVGKAIAEAAKKAGVETVVFDRNGYLYHGRVKQLADAAREGGLKF